MSYHSYNIGALGASDELKCLNLANALPPVVQLDQMVENLARNWNPTGYFRPADVQQVVTMLKDQAADAGRAVSQVATGMLDIEATRSLKNQAFEDMLRAVTDRSKFYEAAIAKARAANVNVIDAPAFKDYVIKALRSISDAYVTASVLDCLPGTALKWVSRGYNGLVAIGNVVIRIAGVVMKVGEAAIDALDTAGGIVAKIIRYAPYAALGIGAYFLYGMIKKRT